MAVPFVFFCSLDATALLLFKSPLVLGGGISYNLRRFTWKGLALEGEATACPRGEVVGNHSRCVLGE